MNELIDLNIKPIKDTLKILLQDKTTKKNIIWATDSYKDLGNEYKDKQQITIGSLTGIHSLILQPRISKSLQQQQDRTKQKAEVFTPSWICNKMNNYCDEQYFGRKEVFNKENDNSWNTIDDKINFANNSWQDYVNLRKLEITCGESPFIVSRYDASTGVLIVPPINRIGFLDRKIRVVNENTTNEQEWFDWIIKAYQSTYGYEFQGDSLLIGRINLLMTFVDNLEYKWFRQPTEKETETIADIISWNLFQMDGLTDTVPLGLPKPKVEEMTIFDFLDEKEENEVEIAPDCKIYDWKNNKSIIFKKIKERKSSMKFDYAIGNPPYQETVDNTSDRAVYNYFMDAAYSVADKVELITPARFLFNAGKTPKQWNSKMLNDEHLKVLMYEQDDSKIFGNTDLKGGVAITYRDSSKILGPIKIYTSFEQLNSILQKVNNLSVSSFSDLIYAPESYKFTNVLYEEHPEIKTMSKIDKKSGKTVPVISKGHDYDIVTNIFDGLLNVAFFKNKPYDKDEYIQMFGRLKNERITLWTKKKYVCFHPNLDKWKVFVPKSNGSGAIGEVLSTPLIGQPLIGHTQSFISIGTFDNESQANNCLKYIKTKFCRTMLGVLKVTQDNKKDTWKYVPMQDFSSTSDIDWTQSIADVDKQLYKKYGLSNEEIEFIETHVKEMV